MKHASLFTGLAFGIAIAAVACSSPSPDGGALTRSEEDKPPPTNTVTKVPTSSSSSSSSSSGSVTTPTPTTDDATTIAACVAQGEDACGDCCATAAPAAGSAYDDARDACLCGAQGHCQAQCGATECSDDDNAPDSQDGDACDLCIQQWAPEDGTGACDAALAAAVDATTDGSLFTRCNDACPDSSDSADDDDSSDDNDFAPHVHHARAHVLHHRR